MEEIEVKFLDINIEESQKKLESVGAKKVGEYFYRRRVFDYPDWRLDKQGAWVRVLDEGNNKVRFGFKRRLGIKTDDGTQNDVGMEEIEVSVSDFEKTAEILRKIGLIEKFYEENKRIRWIKDDIEFDIDTWPKLNTYLEIEAPSWEKIDEAIKMLGLNGEDKKIFSTNQVYKLQGINESDYKRIAFDGFVKRDE